MTGLQTLVYKEVLRFWKVAFQTIGGPVLNAMLYLLIFGHALQDHVKVYDNVSYTAFLVPGLAMMTSPAIQALRTEPKTLQHLPHPQKRQRENLY